MPDIYHADPMLPPGTTLLDVLDARPSDHTPQRTPALVDMGTQVAPELGKRRAALDAAIEHEQDLTRISRELDMRRIQAQEDCARLRIACCDELVGLGPAADAVALAGRLRPADDQVALLADALDLLRFQRIPAARLARKEFSLALRQIEELGASIEAALAQSKLLDKLIVAGVFDGGRVGIIDERIEKLRAAAKECARQVGLAEESLRSERQTQATAQQTRMATGQVTRAEIAAAIPMCAGHAAQ